ncbi:MAG TPA: aldehyde dehydrogenase family protein, partial [Methylomirabilota bacterium]|nr:aldehyde dehydrogenase family protein [Methylomirabilota bacterium]
QQAGFPRNLFRTVLLEAAAVSPLIADRRIVAVTLTGSDHVGSKVAEAAGRELKKTVLELGGSDPFVVLPSADLEAAAATAVSARMVNNGQSCIAAKRFVVAEAVADEFERRFVEGVERLVVGDPLDPRTSVGPLATRAILEGLEAQVRRSVEMGARVLTGGRRLEGPGNYYAPTVLAGVPAAAPAAREEMFGPVAALFRVRDAEEAIRVANDTELGLGASVWTRDAAEQARLVAGIQAGLVFVNAMVASDPRLPFGGVKRSGHGRELGAWGLREFVNIKTVSVREEAAPARTETE